jgi:alpha-tubulin suppressor-like RCC1 family protein
VPVLTSESYKSVVVGGLHSCGVTLDGDARCWGYNVTGQVGDGTRTSALQPAAVIIGKIRTDPLLVFRSPDPDFPLPLGPFMAAGYDHTCAITGAGATQCWGLNEYGQLGDGTTSSQTTPSVVAGGHTFAGITAGLRHTCALDGSGKAFCWGSNSLGQLGDGTTDSHSVPVAVAGGLSFAYLKAGELSTCGVTSDGVAYCWGDNEYGQLGDGTTTSSSSPVKVAFQP